MGANGGVMSKMIIWQNLPKVEIKIVFKNLW
jgi:hypothetical protein